MRPCFPSYTGRPDKKRTAEGEQKVYVRSTNEESGDSRKGGGEGPWAPRGYASTHAPPMSVCIH